MNQQSFILKRKIKVSQPIYWNKEEMKKKTLLIRSELIDNRKVPSCPSISVEHFGKCNIIGYAQCRKDIIDSSLPIQKTILSDIFRIQSNSNGNKYWIHRRLLNANGDDLINYLLTNTKLFKMFEGMGTLIEKPTFVKSTGIPLQSNQLNQSTQPKQISSLSQQHSIQSISLSQLKELQPIKQPIPSFSSNQSNAIQTQSLQPLKQIQQIQKRKSNEIPSISSLLNQPSTSHQSIPLQKTILPKLSTEISSSQSLQPLSSIDTLLSIPTNTNKSSQSINLPQFTTLNNLSSKQSPLNPINSLFKSFPIQRKSTEIIQSITLDILKSLFTLGFECCSLSNATKQLAEHIFGELLNFPLQLLSDHEIRKYTTDMITLIEKSFTKQHAHFLSLLFEYAIQLGQIRKYWNDRLLNKTMLDVLFIELRKLYPKIEFCFSISVKDFVTELSIISNQPSIPHNFSEKYSEVNEIFIWNDDLQKYILSNF